VTQLLDSGALAARWNVPVQTIYGLRYRGEAPPAIRVGRELRWRLEDIEAWENARRDAGSSSTRRVG
jgi:predicted DNA-binding transcriptional regulator AlpA